MAGSDLERDLDKYQTECRDERIAKRLSRSIPARRTYYAVEYIGRRKRLFGQQALGQQVPGGWLLQFNDRRHREAFGWHFFPSADILDMRDLEL